MTIAALSWSGPSRTDVHAFPGIPTRSLSDELFYLVVNPGTGAAEWKTLAEVQAVHINAAPQFLPRFRGAFDVSGNKTGHGVVVDNDTGSVSTTTWPTAPTLWTFLIEVTMFGATTSPGIAPLSIRIHLHEEIQDLWLTPPSMRIRPGNTSQRLTVMARYKDGTVADITEDVPGWPAARWSVTAIGAPPPDPLLINPTEGWMSTAGTAGEWTVRLDLPPLGTGPPRSASASVGAADGWAAAREATWIGGFSPDDRADVPNVLFIADGFTDGSAPPGSTAATPDERNSFDLYVRKVVRQLATSAFQPYDKVAGAMNFWHVFVGSASNGTTICTEHAIATTSSTKAVASPVPAPVRPAAPLLGGLPVGHSGTWTLDEMIHEVGLPVPAYEKATPRPTTVKRLTDWQALYDPNLREAQYAGVLAAWQALGERALLDQAGTAFGLCHGEPPTMEVTSRSFPRTVQFNPQRARQADLDEFLDAITYKGAPVGSSLWGPGKPAGPSGSTPAVPPGKDRGMICLLSRSRRGGGAENADFFAVAIGKDQVLPVTRAGSGWRVDTRPAPAAPFLMATETARTVAHECGHAIGLQDEYGGNGTTPCPSTPTEIATVNASGNLLHAATVGAPPGAVNLTPPTAPSPGWAGWPVWPRIAAAGITFFFTSPFESEVVLADGHTTGFETGAVVQLRTRDLLDRSGGAAVPTYSATMEVASVDHTLGRVALTGPVGGSFIFPEGSVLIRLVLDAARAPLPLLSKVVKDHIESTDRPVNRKPGALCALPVVNGQRLENGILWAVNLPATLLSASSTYQPVERVVGLYDGGKIHNCGVYHATGACLMRGYGFATATGAGFYQLCHVCQYVIADRLDPRAHATVDRDYSKKYPL